MFHLPWDLVEEILSRVSPISLRRLQFTCKRGSALCNDFITKHFDKIAKEKSFLMLNNFRIYSLSVDLKEIYKPSIVITSKLSRSLNESEQVDITEVFHCNGLLLCSTKDEIKTKLMVVNPCTGQSIWIEPRSAYYDRYALGYENNNNNNYKILRFPFDYNMLEIFELKSKSWRVLGNNLTKEDLRTCGEGVSLKGNTYWISYFSGKYDILCFDFTTESFSRLCLPFQMSGLSTIYLSVVREEKLLVLRRKLDMKQIEIWVSNKIDDIETVLSWSNSFTFELCRHLEHLSLSSVSFLIDEEKKVVVSCGRMNKKNMLHIVSEQGGCINFDYDTNKSNDCPLFLFSYVPSLVSLYPPM